MSVGVCIINKNGVAIAADSAGTLGERKMFYNSMNKVFKISSNNIIGAISYGNTDLHNVSIEIILNLFSKYLDSKNKISSFENVIDEFKKFFIDNYKVLEFDKSEKLKCQELIGSLITEWATKIKESYDSNDPKNSIIIVLEKLNSKISNADKIVDYDVSSYIKENYSSFFSGMVSNICKELDAFNDLKDHFFDLICRYFNLSLKNEKNNRIGVLFTGFGEKSVFPAYIHLHLYNCIGGVLKYEIIEEYFEHNYDARILPLAQSQTINTFCKGISDDISAAIPKILSEKIQTALSKLPDDLTSNQISEINKLFNSIPRELTKEINGKSMNDEINPLIASVKVLPLAEMAFLAENLVNITSLKRLYFLDNNQQTVGGPVDVALLSMSNGFEWIKNKNKK